MGELQIRGLPNRLVFSSGSYYRFIKSSSALDYSKSEAYITATPDVVLFGFGVCSLYSSVWIAQLFMLLLITDLSFGS